MVTATMGKRPGQPRGGAGKIARTDKPWVNKIMDGAKNLVCIK